jgi:dimethylhistidine N-methyltransferase
MESFAKSVKDGLSSKTKYLSSRYFYDDTGSQLFKQIMELDEYYLTQAEYEILSTQAGEIYSALEFQGGFNIVELGAGDGQKTIEFLRCLKEKNVDFTYIPIDISQEANDMLLSNVVSALGDIKVAPLTGDYFDMLGQLRQDEKPSMVLFLGSNIGNYTLEDASALLGEINKGMRKGDALLIGVDLKKNPHVIAKAYNDSKGVTRAFNLNLLKRINRELGGDFDLEKWDFYSTYNPRNGEVTSYLISLEEQEVTINELAQSFSFKKNELIYTELSRKYSEEELVELSSSNGFELVHFYKDKNAYFTDVLVVKR